MASNNNIVALLNDVVRDLNAVLDVTTVQCEDEPVENVVNDVIHELIKLVCESTETLQTADTSVKGTSVVVEDEPAIDVLDVATVQSEEETAERVVDDVVEELMTLVCKSPCGDAPSESLQTVDTSLKGTSVAVEDGQGDAAISANHVDVLPAKGVKIQKCFCEPGVTPQQRAPRRRRGFLIAVWRCVKRVVCGVCCLRCGYPFEDE